jgi:hypothetical protein
LLLVKTTRGYQVKLFFVGVSEVEQREGNVPWVPLEGGGGFGTGLLRGLGFRGARAKLPEGP